MIIKGFSAKSGWRQYTYHGAELITRRKNVYTQAMRGDLLLRGVRKLLNAVS